jgi:hypothetical protein
MTKVTCVFETHDPPIENMLFSGRLETAVSVTLLLSVGKSTCDREVAIPEEKTANGPDR